MHTHRLLIDFPTNQLFEPHPSPETVQEPEDRQQILIPWWSLCLQVTRLRCIKGWGLYPGGTGAASTVACWSG